MEAIHIGDLFGDYKVIDIAGFGGMGAVYKIEHVITRRIEAMKLLPPGSDSDPEAMARFEREIQVQARLHHPNIAALYTAVRQGSVVALVMEFVEGESLQRMLEAGPLPVDTAVEFACQVLEALAYAHDAAVVHRDVKPANIIVTPLRLAKLTDFGLALGAADLRLSTSGSPLGSPWYMSPEQVQGTGGIDPRTDIYSMGAVLHEMLTGGKLFDAVGAFEVMRSHVEEEPAPVRSRNPKVSVALEGVVRKALAKDPAMRFQSAEEFRLALETAVAATPAARTIPRLTSRLRGLHPSRAVILMAVVPVTLVAGVYTVRFFPAATHSQPAKSKPRPAALPESHAAQTAPVAAVKVETVEDPGVVPSQPAAVPAVIEKPVAMARPHAAAPARKLRREFEPEQSHAIRVSGADAPPVEAEAEAAPAPCPMPAHSAKAPEACASKPDAVAVPETPDLPMIWGSAPEVPAAPPETSAKPQKSGNRLVRALGKLNPFHKPAKPAAPEASKPPISKD